MRNDRWLTSALALCLASASPAAGHIVRVIAGKVRGQAVVRIQGQDLTPPRVTTHLNGKLYAFEFDASMKGRSHTEKVNVGPLKSVRTGWRTRSKVRVDLRVAKGTRPMLNRQDDGWQISFGNPDGPVRPVAVDVRQVAAAAVVDGLAMGQLAPLPVVNIASTVPTHLKTPGLLPEILPSSPPPPGKSDDSRVSLDFVNTDVVQILKALAIQTGVNVVTSPDVKGSLTVSLHDVTIDAALRLVTTLAGLDYAKVSDTYVVAPTAQLRSIKRQLNGEVEPTADQPIVQTYQVYDMTAESLVSALAGKPESGKATVVGGVTITYSSSSDSSKKKDGPGGDSDGSGGGKKNQPDIPEGIILRGPENQVKSLVQLLDNLTSQRLIFVLPEGSAGELVASITGCDPTAGTATYEDVKIKFSPKSTTPEPVQRIDMSGPGHTVRMLAKMFDSLGAQGLAGPDLRPLDVLEVKFVQPESLRTQLMEAVPGLKVEVAPAATANPRVGATPKATGAPDGAGGGAGSNAAAAAVDAKAGADDRDQRNKSGLMQPYTGFEPTAVPMRLILRGTVDQLRFAREYAAKTDVMPKQVAIELRVMELTKEDALNLGIDWSRTGWGNVSLVNVSETATTSVASGTAKLKTGNGWDVTATLDKIANRQNLIARPNMLAVDGRESEIFVGDVIRYIKSLQSTQNGVTATIEEERVGVRLAVYPRIGADNKITLDMRPVMSYLREYLEVPGGGKIPQTSERMTQATAVVKDGQTIAIGGLILDQDRKYTAGIPFLKDLPIFGHLFRRTDNSKQRTEVVFFLTARVVDDNSLPTAARPDPKDPNREPLNTLNKKKE